MKIIDRVKELIDGLTVNGTVNAVADIDKEEDVRSNYTYTLIDIGEVQNYKNYTDKYKAEINLILHGTEKADTLELHNQIVALFNNTNISDVNVKTYIVKVMDFSEKTDFDKRRWTNFVPLKIVYKEL